MSAVEELARLSGKKPATIYLMCKKLGRLPTLKEVLAVKRGRPIKYINKEKK